jgi:transcriptional repressor NF-X1
MSTASATTSTPTTTGAPNTGNRPGRRRPPQQRPAHPETTIDATAGPSAPSNVEQPVKRNNRPRFDRRRNPDGQGGHQGGSRRDGERPGQSSTASSTVGDGQDADAKRPPRRSRAPPRNPQTDAATAGGVPDADQSSKPAADPKRRRRAPKFHAGLTERDSPADEKKEDISTSARYRNTLPKADDLTSRLIRELSVPPYPDCLICFSSIHPAQPTWSCSPLIPISAATDDENDKIPGRLAETAQCCWTTFHLKCIRSWASKSVKDLEEAWRARGEERKGEWRCPGCQSKRQAVPTSYWYVLHQFNPCRHGSSGAFRCFCGSTPDPKPPRLSTPHSCAGSCTRARACGHSCPLPCHPGPCPPCQITIQVPCFCTKQVLSFRCSNLAPSRAGKPAVPSCGQTCGKRLSCGNHSCDAVCHDGPCAPCPVKVTSRCYCGKDERELACGEGDEKESSILEDGQEHRWIGRFQCENLCDR